MTMLDERKEMTTLIQMEEEHNLNMNCLNIKEKLPNDGKVNPDAWRNDSS